MEPSGSDWCRKHDPFSIQPFSRRKERAMIHRLVTVAAVLGLLAFAPMPAFAQDDCELTIQAGDNLQYSTDEMTVSEGCGEVTVTLEHTGQLNAQQMGHNWVLVDGDWQDVAQAGMSAGPGNDYVPADDERVVAATAVVGGGESDSVTFDVSELGAGEYSFVCTFPGHSAAMNGTFIVN
ncbi:azurin [Spiribacter halobius]|uniref:Azurin n=2 Tax=Sediminicurvatus halobius TaxID=2182432 RepID=A0A2U2MVV8_9GAMM|nr:azurin [Spiribacter halobius]